MRSNALTPRARWTPPPDLALHALTLAPVARADHALELALLVRGVRAFLNEEPPREVLALNAHSLDWEWVLRRAEEERLAPLLYAVLRELPAPVAILDRLRTAWVAFRRQHLLAVELLRGLLSAFEREGVPVIPLKGPTLAEALYRDPGLRPFTDLDLLVQRADLPRALRLLSALGYHHLDVGHSLSHGLAYRNAACFVSTATPPAGFLVDLHWGFVDYPGVAPAGAIDHQEVWGRAVKVEGWDQPVLSLCPEDLLIYLALHLTFHHALSGLLWQLDLALLLRRHGPELNWEDVAERAHRWRVAGALYFALRGVEEQFGVGVPVSLLTRLRPYGLRRAVLDWLCRRTDERLGRLDHLIILLLTDRRSDLLRALARGTVPPAAWVRSRYRKGSVLAAYLAHYGRIARMCAGTVRATFGAVSEPQSGR